MPRFGPLSDFYGTIVQSQANPPNCNGLISNPATSDHLIETGAGTSFTTAPCGSFPGLGSSTPVPLDLCRRSIVCTSVVVTDTDGYANADTFKIPAGLGGYYSFFITFSTQISSGGPATYAFNIEVKVAGVVAYSSFDSGSVNGTINPFIYRRIPFIHANAGDIVQGLSWVFATSGGIAVGTPNNGTCVMQFLGS